MMIIIPVRGGKLMLTPTQSKLIRDEYKRCDGKEVKITITLNRYSRSNRQNRYYWGVVVKILREYFGYTKDEMHSALSLHFLVDDEGEIPRIKSTTELTTVEFEDHMREIRQWASIEWSVYIPLPNETEFDYDVKSIEEEVK